MSTKITVRARARGGKFLADDIGGASVAIRDAVTGAPLAEGVTRGDSGTLSTSYSEAASHCVIVTPGEPPTVQWLSPDATTSRFTAELDLSGPTLLDISAYGPLAGLSSARRATVQQWVDPTHGPGAGLGIVLELPGLLVQPLDPPTHTALALSGTGPVDVPLKANVAMMCGCPISPDKPWIPDDFVVTATVGIVGSSSAPAVVSMGFDGLGVPSLFVGEYQASDPGDYAVTFSAFQQSTGNTGSALVAFTVS